MCCKTTRLQLETRASKQERRICSDAEEQLDITIPSRAVLNFADPHILSIHLPEPYNLSDPEDLGPQP